MNSIRKGKRTKRVVTKSMTSVSSSAAEADYDATPARG